MAEVGTGSRLPNFFIVGVPKAGTTSLYHYLDQHPQIYMSPIKEPGYFAVTGLKGHRFRDQILRPLENDRAGLRAYLDGPMNEKRDHGLVFEWEDYVKLFRNARDETAIGEATVAYFWVEGAAREIRQQVTGARIIMILRDPAERLFSQYLAFSETAPNLTFRARMLAALDPLKPESLWLEIGRYATHVQRFLDLFPREQVRIYLYEDYQADTGALLRDAFAFLGVDPDYRTGISSRRNVPRVPRFPRLHDLRRRLRLATSAGWMPEPLRQGLQRLYYRPRSELRLDPADRRLLIEYHRDEIERLARLIDRDLSAWLR